MAVERYGGIDILVCNAAVNPFFGRMLDASEEVWDKKWLHRYRVIGCWIYAVSTLAGRKLRKQSTGTNADKEARRSIRLFGHCLFPLLCRSRLHHRGDGGGGWWHAVPSMTRVRGAFRFSYDDG
ncbi:putative Dehydrogenase-reductase SDR family member 4-like protein [Naja naja]|nr:putative Dehydrogenase-reductase SDR family member 4-like protein [Naja naja]